jgi:2-polyprenyl-6-methoxyphenol hydroxylase-like FAD-dependent oxidoreductase
MITEPVLISGAGLIGLALAQSLKRLGIPFVIFDRDESVTARGQGWGITLHWALQSLLDVVPEDLHQDIFNAQVIPGFDQKDTGTFLYLDASNCQTVVKIPPSRRLRVRREQLRRVLLSGLDVKWGHQTEDIEVLDDGVVVTCKNGVKLRGSMLIGAEGSSSHSRRFLRPDACDLNQLPVQFCGASVEMTSAEISELQALDPLLFQGTVPGTNTFFWFSLLGSPEYTGKTDTWVAQVNLSWPTNDTSPLKTREEKIAAIKAHSQGLAPVLQRAVDKITSQSEALEIRLADWPCLTWNNRNGRITLVGDAAHAMTMYRGEAANHGITDVYEISEKLDAVHQGKQDLATAIDQFEATMRARAAPAVLLSRQACLDAHNWRSLNAPEKPSPLLTKRSNNVSTATPACS